MSVGSFCANACCCSSFAVCTTSWTVARSLCGLVTGDAEAPAIAVGTGVAELCGVDAFGPMSAAAPTIAIMRAIPAPIGMMVDRRVGRSPVLVVALFSFGLSFIVCFLR